MKTEQSDTFSKQHRVILVVPPMVHLLDINGPAQVYYEARDVNPQIETHFVSMGKSERENSSAGLVLGHLEDFNSFDLTENDWVIVPGLEASTLFSDEFDRDIQQFLEWIKRQSARGAKICSVCTGAFVVAKSGLLDGKECTTHWKFAAHMRNLFPKLKVRNDRLFVKDGNIYSSAGMASGIDLSLFLLEETFGPELTIQVAKEMVIYLRRSPEDPQLSMFLQFRNHIEDRIHRVQDYLGQHLDRPLPSDSLADMVHMSPRNLSRLFKQTTGITLGAYKDQLRVEKALQMLRGGQKVEVVSHSCGMKSANQLRTLLKKYKGLLPHELS